MFMCVCLPTRSGALCHLQSNALKTRTQHGQRGEQMVVPVFGHDFALSLAKGI